MRNKLVYFILVGVFTMAGVPTSSAVEPLIDQRGHVILLVDSSVAAALDHELRRLETDLIGDGWGVIRMDVPRNASVQQIKADITTAYGTASDVQSLFILGHVPFPLYGPVNPDAHGDTYGPCDSFYADIDASWTDLDRDGKINEQTNEIVWQHPTELQVGRVDLFDMPAFGASEIELLRRYLNKDHAYRHKITVTPDRAYYFGTLQMPSAFYNFRDFFPSVEVSYDPTRALTPVLNNAYRWAYGGAYSTAIGLTVQDFVEKDPQVNFSWFFGSYTWDWSQQNALTRAPLASRTYGLSCIWGSSAFGTMAKGDVLAADQRALINRLSYPTYRVTTLMGDPTLRLHTVAPVSNVLAKRLSSERRRGADIAVTWTASSDAVLGYHVYRSPNPQGPFVRLTQEPVVTTEYIDPLAPSGDLTYMVRAVFEQTTTAGSYHNASVGIFSSLNKPPEIQLPQNLVATSLSPTKVAAQVNDDGLPAPSHLDFQWRCVACPQEVAFIPSDRAQTWARFPAAGEYTIMLVAADGEASSNMVTRVTVRDQLTAIGFGRGSPWYQQPFNPRLSPLSISSASSDEAYVSAVIYDQSGKEVVHLNWTQGLVWDGCNSEGHLVASGVYTVLLEKSDATIERRKIVVISKIRFLNIEAFLICDAASDQLGKLNVLGAFDAIVAPKAPVSHPLFAVALRIRFQKSESGNHPFRINIVNEDGKSILAKPIDGNVNVQIREADQSLVINLVGNFRDIRFERFGRYSVDLTMDGQQRGSLPLYVKEAPRPA